MRNTVRVAIAQLNSTVGYLEGNADKVLQNVQKAKELGADFVVFPELALTGYPPEDLLLKPKFVADNVESMRKLVWQIHDIVAIIGFVDRRDKEIYNAAAVVYNGEIKGIEHKIFLPNYGPFDEKRYFTPGQEPFLFQYGHCVFGVNICEDIWHLSGPTKLQARAGARLVININASPYYAGKINLRRNIIKTQARENNTYVVYANLVGGQDELLFDGQSMIVDPKGKVLATLKPFKEDLLAMDIDVSGEHHKGKKERDVIMVDEEPPEKNQVPLPLHTFRILDPVEEIYQALLLGLKDYVSKNGFQKVVIGLSGGIDSALVATLAVDSLGKENVIGVFMPSRYTSKSSEVDTRQLVYNLGIKLTTVSIEQIYKMYMVVLEPHFAGLQRTVAEENLQARIRGNILMAFSNKFGWLVLATGNKSEMSTGYATLYGDMVGGFAVIKDVPKTMVYKLARYRNRVGEVIPENILRKAPTAELKPDQQDTDTLPEYDTLDPILKAHVEEDKDFAQIARLGFNVEVIRKVIGMVERNEYKRRQSPPGIKITPKAFGKDRRMPITNKYRG